MQGFNRVRPIWPILSAAVIALGLLAAPGTARSQSGVNPTAQAVQEQQLLEELGRIDGRITIPDEKAAVLEQPQGRAYRGFHEGALPWIGAVAVPGMLAE